MARIKVIDSYTGAEFPEHRLFAVSYEPYWQFLREELGFTTLVEAERTKARLLEYLGLAIEVRQQQYRLFRVYNYMNAVPIGQPTPSGIMRVPREAEPLIVQFRQEVAKRYRDLGDIDFWDWNTTRLALMILWKEQPDRLYLHWKKLVSSRANKARMMRQPKIELHHYLVMIMELSP